MRTGPQDYTLAMRRSVFSGMPIVSLLVVVVGSTSSTAFIQHQPTRPRAIFDHEPNNLWNRTYACVFIRQTADGKQYGAGRACNIVTWVLQGRDAADEVFGRNNACARP